ncbi:MAG: efflux RND transporter periplasmic adaptor subunit [Calditrichaeota bacterium]|nr:efflux RND transporter periplasmic adaptor subunit [Calditrichota bacterium]MCB9367191.1 efflux RND transporter periplasmic adaptor subunit [Calditrichota bacterium]
MKTRLTAFSFLALVLLLAGCSHEAKLVPADSATLRARTATATEKSLPRLIAVRGTIQAEDDAVLSSRAMGPVVREHALLGDHVRKGQVLLEIEAQMSNGGLAQAQGALAQAQAAASLAERNLKRFEALFEAKACSQLELDMARMQHETAAGAVKQARGAVDQAQSVAQESSIRAPFDGVVVEKFVNVGDLVAPGRPLIRVQTSQGRDLSFVVRSAEASQLTRGTIINCVLDNSQRDVEATITEIAPSADPMTHTVTVKARLSDADSLAAGFTATAEIPGESVNVLLVPKTAVLAAGGLHLATLVDEQGAARTRAVTIGRTRGTDVEILSGLKAGETVVLDRTGVIAEGTRIERTNG